MLAIPSILMTESFYKICIWSFRCYVSVILDQFTDIQVDEKKVFFLPLEYWSKEA